MPSLDRPWTFSEQADEYDRINREQGRKAALAWLDEQNRGVLTEKLAHIAHDEYTARKRKR